jgi:hypothetical protein
MSDVHLLRTKIQCLREKDKNWYMIYRISSHFPPTPPPPTPILAVLTPPFKLNAKPRPSAYNITAHSISPSMEQLLRRFLERLKI